METKAGKTEHLRKELTERPQFLRNYRKIVKKKTHNMYKLLNYGNYKIIEFLNFLFILFNKIAIKLLVLLTKKHIIKEKYSHPQKTEGRKNYID